MAESNQALQTVDRDLQVVEIQTEAGALKLTPAIVRKYIAVGNANITDQEVMMFLALCKYQRLNPFLREAYLIKYGNDASIVVGKETYTKRAYKAEDFRGFKAGVILWKDEELKFEEGAFVPPGWELIGGWAEVYHGSKWDFPTKVCVGFNEYVGKTKDGVPNRQWATKPATMIRKVALVQSLREAFPDDLAGMISEEEIPSLDAAQLPRGPVDIGPVLDVGNGQPEASSTPVNGGQQTAQQPPPQQQNKVKRMRKNKFQVNPEQFRGQSEIITCGVTPDEISELRIAAASDPLIRGRIVDFVRTVTGYDEVSFLRSEEAGQLLDQVRRIIQEKGKTEEQEEKPPVQMNEEGVFEGEETVRCPMNPDEATLKSWCLNRCQTRKQDGFCLAIGENPPASGMMGGAA